MAVKNSTGLVPRFPAMRVKIWASAGIVKQDWRNNVFVHPCSVNELASSFTQNISQAMEIFFPNSVVKCHYSDKPWITSSISKSSSSNDRKPTTAVIKTLGYLTEIRSNPQSLWPNRTFNLEMIKHNLRN